MKRHNEDCRRLPTVVKVFGNQTTVAPVIQEAGILRRCHGETPFRTSPYKLPCLKLLSLTEEDITQLTKANIIY